MKILPLCFAWLVLLLSPCGLEAQRLVGSTYSGSSTQQYAVSACHDASGNAYLVGRVYGESVGRLEATPGVVQLPLIGWPTTSRSPSVSVAKFTQDLSALLFFTYLGSSEAIAAATNEAGDLFVLGYTLSTNFPVTENAFQKKLAWTPHPFLPDADFTLTRLSNDGTALMGSTYVGSLDKDDGFSGFNRTRDWIDPNPIRNILGRVAMDIDGNPMVVSHTSGHDFPGSLFEPDRVPPTRGGLSVNSSMAVVFKMNGDLSALLWSGLIGKNPGDHTTSTIGTAVVGTRDFVYVAGHTMFPSFTPAAAYTGGQNRSAETDGDVRDGFVVAIPRSDLESQSLTIGLTVRFLGGSQEDRVYQMDADSEGNVYVTGQTHGGYPVQDTADRFHQPEGGHFIHKFAPDLTSRWAITFGNISEKPQLFSTAFRIDHCDRILLTGWGGRTHAFPGGPDTDPSDDRSFLPTTLDAVKGRPGPSGASDYYSLVLAKDAESLIYGSYFGGDEAPESMGNASHYSKEGVLYQAAHTHRNRGDGLVEDYPTTPNAFSPNFSTQADEFRGVFTDMVGFTIDFSVSARKDPFFTTDTLIGGDVGIDTVCAPSRLVFTPAEPSLPSDVWEVEKEGEGLLASEKRAGPFSFSFVREGIYRVRLRFTEDTCTGAGVFERTITVHTHRSFEIAGDLNLCGDGSTTTLRAYTAPPTNADVQYEWIPSTLIRGANDGPEITTLPLRLGETALRLTISGEGVCVVTEHAVVKVVPKPVLSIQTSNPSLSSCRWENQVELTGRIQHARSFHWVLGDGTPISTYEDVGVLTHEYATAGSYTVQLVGEATQTAGECRATATREIAVRKAAFPNIITPNGDGINDRFQLPSVSLGSDGGAYGMRVYDRLGHAVYTNERYDNQWSAEGLPADVYFYTLTLPRSAEVCKGWLHVMK